MTDRPTDRPTDPEELRLWMLHWKHERDRKAQVEADAQAKLREAWEARPRTAAELQADARRAETPAQTAARIAEMDKRIEQYNNKKAEVRLSDIGQGIGRGVLAVFAIVVLLLFAILIDAIVTDNWGLWGR